MLTGSETTLAPPVIRPKANWKPIYLLAAGVFCAAVAAVFFLFDPTRVPIFVPCLFHQMTGLDCPGCGAQRALHQLLHGNVVAAIRLNAMFVFSLPLFAWLGVRAAMRSFRGERSSFYFKGVWTYLAAWILFGVLRNLPFPVCHWFAASWFPG
jgi:hypothetical protein